MRANPSAPPLPPPPLSADRHIRSLLILEEKGSVELAGALLAGIMEMESVYEKVAGLGTFERFVLSPFAPNAASRWQLFNKMLGRSSSIAQLDPKQYLKQSVPSDRTVGRFSKTYDQEKLGAVVEEMLGPVQERGRLLIVTDREITPPEGYRYIIWSGIRQGIVVSVAPTDPSYWGERTPQRISTIKHRVRTACLSACGEMLGLKRCDNDRCVLFNDVDSSTTLDTMTLFGPEHQLPDLSGKGFEALVRDPATIQTLVTGPEPEGSMAR